jgi:tRNA1(Val) A37 N6-methylase TrmN6
MTESVDPELGAEVDAWCELQGLDRLDNPHEIVARQAALNTLLKTTLYEQYHKQGRLPALTEDLQAEFKNARTEIGDPAFTEYVLDRVTRLVEIGDLSDLLSARHSLVDAADPAEEIGRLFESLTPQASRRKLGQFRTPPTIASLMATWLIRDGTETVLDPGMGAGALAAAAYQRKQELVDDPPLTDMYGVDLNQLALVMAATSLGLLNHGEPHNLQIGDFLDFETSDVDGEIEAIISNPPYSRHHELTADYKARVNAQAEAETDTTVSALSPMYAYFYYHASEFLPPGGRLSFITPSEFLETSYGESLKRFLVEAFDIRTLVLFDRDESSKFDEAMTTSLVSFLEKSTEDDKPTNYTRLIRVDGDPSQTELLAAIDGEVDGETDWGFVNVVPQAELDPVDKWTSLFDPLEIDTSDLVPLSELATVTRGIATGQNSYYCLTQDDVDDWNIDDRYLSKIIRNARSVPGYDYTVDDWEDDREEGREVWVLYHLTDLDSETVSHLQPAEDGGNQTLAASEDASHNQESTAGIVDYLRYGRSEDVGAQSGYLAQHRTPWYVVDRRDPPPIVVTYMSRGGSRFIQNETDARTLSNLHGLYLDVDLSDTQRKALLAYLNSGFANEVVRRSGRTYSSGMDKIEPNELEGVPVLDPRSLDTETTSGLARRFDRVRQAAREESDSIEAAIQALDRFLKRVR